MSSSDSHPAPAPAGALLSDPCEAIFRRAFAHHARSELAIAAAFYEWLMELEPERARAWHWYGVIRLEQGDAAAALNFISKAVTLDPTDATVFMNLGNVFQALDKHTEAVQVYEAALTLQPSYAQAALNCGNSLRTLKRYDEARNLYRLAIQLRADYGSAHFNLGNLLSEMGLSDDALKAYDDALSCNADTADVWCNRGNLLKRVGRLQDALASYSEAIRLKPTDASVWSNRGLTRHELGDYGQAVADFDHALGLRPDFVNALSNKGNSLRADGDNDAAMRCYDDALELDAAHAQTHCNRGLLFRELNQSEEAMSSFDEAIRCNPDLAQAYSNRALMLKAQGDFDASLRDQLQALTLDPLLADAHTNLGALYHDLNRIDEAIACHRKAITLQPEHPQANWNLSLDLILQGQMDEGWPLYEWRLRKGKQSRTELHHGRPRWNPQDSLQGKSILLTHEQGFGDTLQFCRYVLLLEACGAQVLMEVPQTLHGILKTLSPSLRLFVPDACSDAFDVWSPLLSLPMALKTTLDNIPSWPFYLSADANKTAQWEGRLSALPQRQYNGAHGHAAHDAPIVSQVPQSLMRALTELSLAMNRRMRIGLCVSGNPLHENTANRDMSLAALLAVLPDCHDYVLLHKQLSDEEQAALTATPLSVTQWTDVLEDFSDTAALCKCLDLVITVDTSVAHLSAALGCPTWILLAWVPDWRWLQVRTDTPWYPSVRLFRQQSMKDWGPPMRTVGSALESVCPE